MKMIQKGLIAATLALTLGLPAFAANQLPAQSKDGANSVITKQDLDNLKKDMMILIAMAHTLGKTVKEEASSPETLSKLEQIKKATLDALKWSGQLADKVVSGAVCELGKKYADKYLGPKSNTSTGTSGK